MAAEDDEAEVRFRVGSRRALEDHRSKAPYSWVSVHVCASPQSTFDALLYSDV